MKNHNSTLQKGGVNHLKLATIKDINTAIKNSKNNFAMEDNGIIPVVFSTQMFVVAEKLKEAME